MPYANEASVLVIGGLAQLPVVTVRLWDVYTTVGGPSGPEEHEDEFDSTTFQASTNRVPFSLVRGPGGLLPSRSVALSMDIGTGLQDGPIFRSGVFTTLPPGSPADPNGFIDIVLDDMRTVTQGTVNASLPTTPFTLSGQDGSTVTVTTLTATIGSGSMAVAVAGTATHPQLPVAQPFTYSVSLAMFPESSSRDLTISLVARAPAPGTLTFTSAGGVTGAIQTGILTLLSGWIEGDLRSRVVAAVNTAVNGAAITAVASALGVQTPPGSPPALPPGVVLSFRRVTLGSISGVTGIHVWAAIGSFGSLAARFPQTSDGGRRCILALLALSVPRLDLSLFRAVRDELLAPRRGIRRLVRLYYRESPRVTRLVRTRPGLRWTTGQLALALQPLLRRLLARSDHG